MTGGAGAGGVDLDRVTKRFDETVAVDDVSLAVAPGEFFSLLGPSGCGKTTSLRMIAGFERPDDGRVLIGERDLTDVPPHKRPVNTVFQSYALFPHLTVGENVEFGLRFRRVSKDEKRRRAGEMLEVVRLGGFQERKPHQLSGGQQQRVALARALILAPEVLLLDEPLGALDAKLRRELQLELKSLQREVGITFVYVTHDQEEALTMSDRIAVMNHGRIEQLGTPRRLYEEPATVFVANFLGVSNLMPCTCDGQGGVTLEGGLHRAAAGSTGTAGEAHVTIRPERVEVELDAAAGPNVISGRVQNLVYLGAATQVVVRLSSGTMVQALAPSAGRPLPYAEGDAVAVRLPPDALRVIAGADGGVRY
jgi:spermidine/putrescine transport system ATP-binding protein